MTASKTRTAFLTAGAIALLAAWFLARRISPGPDTSALLLQVREIQRLATVHYTVQKIVTLEEQKQPVGSERILLVVQASVEAGVDLAQLQERDITRTPDGTVLIRLPPAQILTAAIDENETRVWDRSKTWWTPWIPFNPDLEKQARMAGLEAAKKSALDMGILKQADAAAATAVAGLLKISGLTKVKVIPGSAT